jgi:ABC-2 type transport system ATP-binding protein
VREVHVDEGARQLTAPADGLADVTRIASVFDGSEIVLDDLGLKRPSLDDVFLHLTGRRAEETTDEVADEVADDTEPEPKGGRR